MSDDVNRERAKAKRVEELAATARDAKRRTDEAEAQEASESIEGGWGKILPKDRW